MRKEITKITFEEFVKRMLDHGKYDNNEDWENAIHGIIVFKTENWPGKNYTEQQRSYRVSSANRCFQQGKIANSMYGDCLDGIDLGVRLDWYQWEPEYCYFE